MKSLRMARSSPTDRPLFVQSEQWFHRASAALLGSLPCRRGCHRCCIGPFAITILDAEELQRGLPALPAHTRRDIESRARAQAAALESAYPRLKATPFLDGWPDGEIDRLVAQFAELPCPALDKDGSCRVYPFRPLVCRTMGIPTESDGLVQGACEVQTSVPLIRPSRATREQEQQLAGQEAVEIATRCGTAPESGEEVLLAYGFLPEDA
ncbi:MAG TPA: YkgJ family cysteine cluster protein [Nitrospiraceae bacterium]|nr:YkgJ family cysteine cluster protein [Nitrospiraceae bacterium]